MGPELPDVARLRDRDVRKRRDLVLVSQTDRYPRKGSRQFLAAEAKGRQIRTDGREIRELKAEHLAIPTGIHCDPVIGNNQLPTLNFGKASQYDHRRFG